MSILGRARRAVYRAVMPRLSRSSGVIVPVTFKFSVGLHAAYRGFRARTDDVVDPPRVVTVGVEGGLNLLDDRLEALTVAGKDRQGRCGRRRRSRGRALAYSELVAFRRRRRWRRRCL